MSKKTAKIAATYFVTIIVSLLLIGAAGYYALTKYMNMEKESGIKPVGGAQSNESEEYAPTEGFGQTYLFIYEPEQRLTAVSFIMARFIPYESKLVIVPLQADVCADLNGRSNTLYEFYRVGGTSEAVKAVEAATNVHIDRYMKFSKENFTLFSNFCGNISYYIPYNLAFENPDTGESTIIKEGEQTLDSVTLRKVLTYPNYTGGEEYRAKVVGTIIADLINSGCKGMLKTSPRTVFNDVINSGVETNITVYDFEEDLRDIEYVLENTTSPVQLVFPSGSYNSNNCYVLEDSFVAALPRWLSLE